jgi:hypothetical protein
MSSIATAPARTAEKEPEKSRQRFLVDDEPRSHEFSRAEAPSGNIQADEVTRVERLLTQLEARSMALVPYAYGTLREPPPRRMNTAVIAGVMATIWLSTVFLAVTYIRYNRPPVQLVDRAAPVTPLLIPASPDPQEQRVASSVDHLAKALLSSSERMTALQVAMERSNRDLQRIATKVSERSKPAPAIVPTAAGTDTSLATGRETLPKNWHKVLDIKPTESAVAHRAVDGTVDYWIVQRGADRAEAKVLSIGTSPDGVVIHNLEDGKDYTLTPSGEWRNSGIVTPVN